MPPPLIVMRFDAGRAVGMGHAVRSVALAQALAARGARVAIAANAAGQAVVRGAAPGTAWPMRAARTPLALRRAWSGCDALIVDSYALGHGFEGACRGWAKRIVALDDLPTRRHDCDLLLDQTLGRRPSEYRGLVPIRATILAGRRYALLRPAFLETRRRLRRRFRADDRRILVTLGGGDQSARLDALLGAAPRRTPPLSITVLGRPGRGARRAGVEAVAGDFGVAPRFAAADLAISAAGSTAWEMSCLGLPMVLLPIAANQRDVAASLARRGVAVRVAAGDAAGAWRVALALLANPGRRRAMSEKGRAFIDGAGARRAADAILALIGGRR